MDSPVFAPFQGEDVLVVAAALVGLLTVLLAVLSSWATGSTAGGSSATPTGA